MATRWALSHREEGALVRGGDEEVGMCGYCCGGQSKATPPPCGADELGVVTVIVDDIAAPMANVHVRAARIRSAA